MSCKNLTDVVEVQYKYVEFSKKFRWENWTTLTNYKDSWHSNITVVACEQALLFRRARGRGKESLQRSPINFHLYFAQMKGNTIGWKVTFQKSKLIDNTPSWPALNFRGNVETRCSYRQNPCYVEDRSDRVCSSCGRKIRTLHQVYSFVSSALFSSKNEKGESEERFKRRFKRWPSNVGFYSWFLRPIEFHWVEKFRNMHMTA